MFGRRRVRGVRTDVRIQIPHTLKETRPNLTFKENNEEEKKNPTKLSTNNNNRNHVNLCVRMCVSVCVFVYFSTNTFYIIEGYSFLNNYVCMHRQFKNEESKIEKKYIYFVVH